MLKWTLAMTRYFFTLESPSLTVSDDDGEELANDAVAHNAAVQTVSELSGERFIGHQASIVVRTADNRIVAIVPFLDTVMMERCRYTLPIT